MDNDIIVKILKELENSAGRIYWIDGLTFNSIDLCLASINMNSCNGGFYKPKAFRVKNVNGLFLKNEDGSIFFESRIKKIKSDEFIIENLSSDGFLFFEKRYSELLNGTL